MSSSGPVFQNSVYVGINLQNILYGKLKKSRVGVLCRLTSSLVRRHRVNAVLQDDARLLVVQDAT